MSTSEAEDLVLREVTSPRHARVEAVRVLGDQCDAGLLGDILVVISELVTNALCHTGSGCSLAIHQDADSVVVEVSDSNTPPSAEVPLDDGELLGRGLGVVQTLSHRWGIERLHMGKCVWAEIAAS